MNDAFILIGTSLMGIALLCELVLTARDPNVAEQLQRKRFALAAGLMAVAFLFQLVGTLIAGSEDVVAGLHTVNLALLAALVLVVRRHGHRR